MGVQQTVSEPAPVARRRTNRSRGSPARTPASGPSGPLVTLRIGLALVFAAVVTLVLSPLQWVLLNTELYKGFWILRVWHRSMARALGLRIRVVGEPASGRPLMIASNHVSWTDITVLGSIADLSFIAKSEMSGWPLVGWLSRLQRTVFIERERRRKSGEQASEIAARMDAGDAMVLFAEGTTGDGNMVLPFKSTLFGAASLMLAESRHDRVWIQPVALAYTRLHGIPMGRQHRWIASWIGDQDLVTHVRALLAERALDVEVHFGAPVAFERGSNRKETARSIETEVRRMLNEALARPLP